MVVAIAGGSATGKSTLARALAAAVPELDPVVICQDRYFRDFMEYTPEERERVRTANHPSAVLWSAFHDALESLLAGGVAHEPVPGTRGFRRGEASQVLGPTRLLIIEGLFALWDERSRQAADVRLYTEVDDDERVLRRLNRDILERGGTVDGVLSWYRRDVKPNFPVYTASTRYFADLIVPTHHPVDVAVQTVAAAVRASAAQLHRSRSADRPGNQSS